MTKTAGTGAEVKGLDLQRNQKSIAMTRNRRRPIEPYQTPRLPRPGPGKPVRHRFTDFALI